MRPYATVVPTFWTAFRVRVMKECGTDAQDVLLLALYVITSPGSNMLGLYYLPLPIIAHEIGLPLQRVIQGLDHLKRLEFCVYDDARELIWVRNMAKFQIGEALSAGDKRCAMVRKEIARIGENEFTQQFIGMYSVNYHLETNAPSKPLPCQSLNNPDAPSKHLSHHERTTDAPSKPLVCATEGATLPVIQEQEQEQEQKQEQKDTPAPSGASAPGGASHVSYDMNLFLELWNQNCGPLPKIREITREREKKLRGKLKLSESFGKDFEDAIKRAARSPFTSGGSESGWRADFDWMLDNYHKVCEGSYDNTPREKNHRDSGGAYRGGDSNRFNTVPAFVVK